MKVSCWHDAPKFSSERFQEACVCVCVCVLERWVRGSQELVSPRHRQIIGDFSSSKYDAVSIYIHAFCRHLAAPLFFLGLSLQPVLLRERSSGSLAEGAKQRLIYNQLSAPSAVSVFVLLYQYLYFCTSKASRPALMLYCLFERLFQLARNSAETGRSWCQR